MAAIDPKGKGWFAVDGMQRGDRTLDEQMTGLDVLMSHSPGSTILDLGCAEGLISLEMMGMGATLTHGVESVASRIETAQKFFMGRAAEFFVADLAEFHTNPPEHLLPSYDVVLMLSIAQKMPDPKAFIAAAAERAGKVVALRLPAPVICDRRSDFVELDVVPFMASLGFPNVLTAEGPRGEWVGVFTR